jgi:hypothetical protein
MQPGMTTTGGDDTLILTNYTGKSIAAELRFDVVLKGSPHYVWTTLEVPPGSLTLTVHYFATVDSSVSSICATSSIGIVESPDPILSVTPPPPGPDDGGGMPLN